MPSPADQGRLETEFETMKPQPCYTNFAAWMAAVDNVLVRLYGLTSADLPDYLYHDDFEDQISPRGAAAAAVRAARDS
jgi:hypothetical protein